MPHQLRTLDSSPGVIETQLHPHTGLRISHYHTLLTTFQTHIVNARPATTATAFTTVTVADDRVPFPCTLTVHLFQAAAETGPSVGGLRVRIKGRDQYGQYQEETTPNVSVAAKTNNFVFMSKVFARVDRVEYLRSRTSGTGPSDTISVGPRFQWNPSNDGSNEYLNNDNLGVALFRWTREHQQGAASGLTHQFTRYDSITSLEVPKISAYNLTTNGVMNNFTPLIGIADTTDWEASTDKWHLPGTPAQAWGLNDIVEVNVHQLTRLDGFNR
jgi:hypothetical protein